MSSFGRKETFAWEWGVREVAPYNHCTLFIRRGDHWSPAFLWREGEPLPYGEILLFIYMGGYYPPALNSIYHKNGRSMNAPTDRFHYSSVGATIGRPYFLWREGESLPYGEISSYICRGGYYPPALNSIYHKNGRSMNAPTKSITFFICRGRRPRRPESVAK